MMPGGSGTFACALAARSKAEISPAEDSYNDLRPEASRRSNRGGSSRPSAVQRRVSASRPSASHISNGPRSHPNPQRSEERRVGKESRSWWLTYQEKKERRK